VFLDGREQGFGIPDDITMRLNISTALAVRDMLDDVLPDSVTEPGTEMAYDRRAVPDHVAALVELLQDPDRELTVGGSTVTASDVLGRACATSRICTGCGCRADGVSAGGRGRRDLLGSVDDGLGEVGQAPVAASGAAAKQCEGFRHVQLEAFG